MEPIITPDIVVAYAQCPRKAYLLLFSPDKGEPNEYIQILEQQRCENQERYLDHLQHTHADVQPYSEENLRKGSQVLINAHLQVDGFAADCGVLTKVEGTSTFGKYRYEPSICVGTHSVSKEQKLALSFVGYVLERLQHKSPARGRMIGMDGKSHTVKLDTITPKLRTIFPTLQQWLGTPPNEPPPLILNKHCPYCQFREECRTKARAIDHLSLLGGMSKKEIEAQNKKGIFTIDQLSYTFMPRKRRKYPYKTHAFPWELKALALREKKTYIREIPKFPSSSIEIYLDFEGLPEVSFIYLIGIVINYREKIEHISLWSNSKNDEENNFIELFNILSRFDDFVIYHYGSYEITSLKSMNKKFNNKFNDEIELIIQRSFNILNLFRSNVYPPTYTNSLKEIANFLEFRWSNKMASGIQSIVWRKRWERTNDNEYKFNLLQYNKEDLLALILVKNWLAEIEKKFDKGESEHYISMNNIKDESYLKWGNPNYRIQDFEEINKFAYFDYQHTKIYLRTNKKIKKGLKKKESLDKLYNKIDKKFQMFPKTCPNCRHNEFSRTKKHTKIVTDLKFSKNGIRRWVVGFDGGSFRCLKCKKIFTPDNFSNLPKYGHNLISWSINHYVSYRVGLNKVVDILSESFHIHVPQSIMYRFKLHFSEKYAATFAEIKQNIVNGSLIHVDETEVNIRDSSGYVWVFTNMDSVFYLFRPNREAVFLEDLLKDFNGILVSDFYPGYDSLPCLQQKCLIHLIRDLNNDLLKNQFDIEFKNIVIEFGKLLRHIVETIDKYGLKKVHLHRHSKEVNKFYDNVIYKEYKSEIAISYQKRFDKNVNKLFTFLNFDGIPWNNNNGEHAIKPFAKYRRDNDGLFTEKSIKEYLDLLSIQQTCKYRNISFLEFLKSNETSIEVYSKRI